MTANAANVIDFIQGRPFCYQWKDRLIESDLPAYCKLLGLILVNYMNGEKNYCFPSVSRLSKQASITKKTCLKYLKELATKGYLLIQQRRIDGNQITNIYRLQAKNKTDVSGNSSIHATPLKTEGCSTYTGGGVSQGNTGVYHVHPNYQYNYQPNNKQTYQQCSQENLISFDDDLLNKKSSISKSDKTDKSDNDLERKFQEFWDAYPKKTGRKYAHKIFKRINPSDALFKRIMHALVQANAFSWRSVEKRYIPNPSTWLNQERWEDELINYGESSKNRLEGADAVAAYNAQFDDDVEFTIDG